MAPPRSPLFRLLAIVAAVVAPPLAAAQCGSTVTGHFGGETTGVVQVNATTLMVAHGTELEMLSLATSSAPASYSPRRTMGLMAPAIKLSMTQGSSKAFVLLANGYVQVVSVFGSTFIQNPPTLIYSSRAQDIVADGLRVYIAASDDDGNSDHPYSRVIEYNASSGTPAFVWETEALLPYDYAFDRVTILNGVLWAGFHQRNSNILGVDGFNLSNPESPTRIGTALTNAVLSQYTARISAMTGFNGKLLVSYRNGVSNNEDWLRCVNVSVPSNPVWNPAFDLNGYAGTMSFVNHQMRISIKNSGVGTWDTQNPAALSWLGGYFNQFPQIGQMVSVPATDYWAAGPAGLMTMNTTNPANVTPRSTPLVPLPTSPKVVRQRGNITVVLDYTLNALRFYDYTMPDGQQLRGTYYDLPWYSELVELGELTGGVGLACVASQGNPAGDVIAIIDFTNPAAPFLRSTITGFKTHLLSVSASRLYAFTTTSEFKIYELSQNPAQHRSTTPFGGFASNYTCMESWSNNAAAIGTKTFGLWTINTTNALAPVVSDVWNPAAGYRVYSMVKTPNYLYTSATVTGSEPQLTDSRMEVLVVSNIANVTERFAVTPTRGFGSPGVYSSLTYVANPVSNFIVGTRGTGHIPGTFNDDAPDNSVVIFQLASFFFTENLPTPIAYIPTPFGHGRVAVNAGSSKFIVAGDHAGLYQINVPTNWAPGFGVRPFDQQPCIGSTAFVQCLAFGNPTEVSFQWYRDGVAITDGPTPWGSTITGANTFSMEIANIQEGNAHGGIFGQYDYTCRATNTCGTTHSHWAQLDVCYANCDCSTGEALLTANDFQCFLNAFAGGEGYANCDKSSVAPVLTANDFMCFMNKFANGCR